MSGETILIVPDAPASVGDCLRAAQGAAAAFDGARIEVLDIRPDPAGIVQWPDVLTKAYEAALDARSDAEHAARRTAFDAWHAANPADAAAWTEITDGPPQAILTRGRAAALLVLPPPGPTTHPAMAAGFDAALFEADRPVLMVPPGTDAPFGRHLAVGWRDSPLTRRSLERLRPWLMAADTISAIAVTDEQAKLPSDWAAANLPAGVRLRVIRPAGRRDGEALLAEALAIGADGLAMGAYRHGRLVERLIGGMTADVLRSAPMPVLMHV